MTSKQGVLIELLITPNAKKSEFVRRQGEALKLKIKAPPVDGKANAEVIRFLSELFNVPKANVSIVRGELSKKKTVAIAGRSFSEVQKVLTDLLQTGSHRSLPR